MAGVTNTNVQASLTTDALFRTWGSGISAGLSAAGLVQTADTGQVNWSTVTRATANTTSGYEVWKFNDSLQSTAPVYIKLEYGISTGTSSPQLWVTVGTGSDGAGNITGTAITGVGGAITSKQNVFSTAQGSPTATGSTYVYGDGSSLAILMWPSIGTSFGGAFVVIERWRNWDGTASGDGVSMWGCAAVNSSSQFFNSICYIPAITQNPFNATGSISPYSPNGQIPNTTNISGTVYPLPVFHGIGRAMGPSQYALHTLLGDYPPGTVSITHYGTARSFYAVGAGASVSPGWGIGPGGNAKSSWLIRIE